MYLLSVVVNRQIQNCIKLIPLRWQLIICFLPRDSSDITGKKMRITAVIWRKDKSAILDKLLVLLGRWPKFILAPEMNSRKERIDLISKCHLGISNITAEDKYILC